MESSTEFRLPQNVIPERYEINLEPDLENFVFYGSEAIYVRVSEPTLIIQMNASELDVTEASIVLPGLDPIKPTIALDPSTERLTLSVNTELPVGEACLNLSFSGLLNDQLRGFYRSEYSKPDGSKGFLATTQFEATDARRAFPCWDEPNIKAIFDVALIVDHQDVAISNMPQATEHPTSGSKRLVRFQPTPPMSTYLLAFIVGDLASVQGKAKNGTRIRVWATRGKEYQGRFALENSVRILDYMNEYFGIDYPLPKMDHIAIPDFAAGAMENWGAITYRETALLFDPDNSAAQARQRILEVVAHEMAHMWFGDLVTMDWWDDLWLNESFASWMGDKAVDYLYPEWEMWTQFVSQDTNSALALDGLRNSHPIEAQVQDPSEIRELFDAISYSKGGSVLRMLENFLGSEIFQHGLTDYLQRHSYGNARTKDLWNALGEASGKPVTEIMDSWVKQTGFPVVDAHISESEHDLAIELSQHRFLYGNIEKPDPDPTSWQIPVNIGYADSANGQSVLVTAKTLTVKSEVSTARWVKINSGQAGFFRVRYTEDYWERLRSAVERQELAPTDRLSIQNDAYALMRAGYIPATSFLSLARAYRQELAAPVWSDLALNLRGLEALLVDQPCASAYRAFAGSIFSPMASQLAWEPVDGEAHLDSLRRTTVIGQAGAYGDAAILQEATRRFHAYTSDADSLHPDLRALVLNLAAQQGDRSTYDKIWELERESSLQEEKMRFLAALSRFQDPFLLENLLERSLTDEVRVQDAWVVLVQVAATSRGRDLAWRFVQDHWSEFDRRYGDGGFAIARVVGITGSFTTTEQAVEVEQFFNDHPAPSASRTIQQSLERIRLNASWVKTNAQSVDRWLLTSGD